MSGVKEIQIERAGARDLALIGADDSVWLVVPLRWWDLSSILFWFFLPVDRRMYIDLTMIGGEKVRFTAARVATRHMRVKGLYK